MKVLPHTLLAIVMLTGGILLGRGLSPGGKDSTATADPVANRSSRPNRARMATRGPEADRHDLASLKAIHERNVHKGTDQQRSMESLDAAALKALALEQWALTKSTTTDDEAAARRQVADDALRELYDREGVAALEWAEGLEKDDTTASIGAALLTHAFRNDPVSAQPWLDKYIAKNGRNWAIHEICRSGVLGAAERGADEVIRVVGIFNDPSYSALQNVDFPEGFDFAKLHAALGGTTDIGLALSQWTIRDPEAAWTAVKDKIEAAPGMRGYTVEAFGSVMMGAVAKDGEIAGVTWAMERLAELTPALRAACLQRINTEGELSVEGMSALAGHLPTEERQTFAHNLIGKQGITPNALALLDAMPREDMLALLSGDVALIPVHSGPAAGTAAHDSQSRKLRGELQTRYQLSPEEMERIMK